MFIAIGVMVAIGLLAWLSRGSSPSKPAPIVSTLVPATEPGKGKRIVVTGGNGFLGRAVVAHLLRDGEYDDIVVFDLAPPPPEEQRPSSVSYFRGSVTEAAHLDEALAGADAVIHVASILPSVLVRPSFMTNVNVEGTRHVIEACLRQQVPRLIYTSSATVVLSADELVTDRADESAPYPEKHLDLYTTTKAAAERLVNKAHDGRRLYTCICRPSGIFGPGDRLLYDRFILGEDLFVIGDGNSVMDFVAVDDVAEGHVAALRHLGPETDGNANGETFNLCAPEPVLYKEFNGIGSDYLGDKTKSHWGHDFPRLLPVNVVLGIATINELGARFLGKAPFSEALSKFSVRFTQRSWSFSCQKARDLLDWNHEHGGTIGSIKAYVAEYHARQRGDDEEKKD